jgi:hypothetical protein
VHRNLAVYFIHGSSATGSVPLTLTEALVKGTVQVTETGVVNELRIENAGDEEVFVQAGDMVKGGRQDRVLVVSLLLPPRSGPVPISSFCVEPGRWTARGGEDPTRFTTASEAMPSRRALVVMAAPSPPAPAPAQVRESPVGITASRQQQVWDTVAKTQAGLASGLGASVASPQSATSLQLSLEHAALKKVQVPYLEALAAVGLKDGDVIGYVAAINGRPVSADLYLSNDLFRKMWPKQLAALVTEALGDKSGEVAAPPVTEIREFLAAAERGIARESHSAFQMRQETRESDRALYIEARDAGRGWVHKSYLAK